VKQNTELYFSRFRTHHSFHPVTSSASVKYTTSINITQMFVDFSHYLFLSNKEFYQIKLFVSHITD
jgi:hypothetical protein